MVCGDDVVLATNTSSIPVTSLAGAAARPENVVGMHFFNPPPLMPLLEVIRAEQSSDEAVARARELGEAMGKEVIVAADGPGFLVNRCGRPFNGEGLRLLQERVATHEQIDRICRLGGGFRMGPFELMDLVGIDVGFEVAKSFDELSFGEPRWRPNPIQARMVAAGRLGRKTGRGYYEYAEDGVVPAGRSRAAGARRRRRHAPDHPRRRARWPTGSASAAGTPGTSSARAGRASWSSTRGCARRIHPPAARRSASCAPPAASRHAASRARWASTCSPTRSSSSSPGCPRPRSSRRQPCRSASNGSAS